MPGRTLVENKTFDEITVGDNASMERPLTMKEVELFAVVSGDLNPTHYNEEVAQETLVNKEIMGHSLWSGTLFSGLLGTDLPGAGTVYKKQDFEFHQPVALGDTVKASVTVSDKDASDKSIRFDCKAVNQKGDIIVTGVAEVFAPAKKISHMMPEMPTVSVQSHDTFERLIRDATGHGAVSTAVAHPCEITALSGPIEAAQKGLIDPILVGPKDKIAQVAEEGGLDLSPYKIVDAAHSHESAAKAVELVREGGVEMVMKGSLHSDEILGAVAARDTGLRTGRRISHCFVMDVPAYPQLMIITDAAVNIYPKLTDKVDILCNAIELARALDLDPRVAVLSAMETVNEKVPSTLEAAALCKMMDRGQIAERALIDGPLAMDNAISPEAAAIKGIESPVAGRANILLAPDLEAGNMIAKQLTFMAHADAAGIVLGARVPVVLTSRADNRRARIASCAIAAELAHTRRADQKVTH
ncbi:MAG: bifunctional enoyl-CoA hydratase/phosphate acetyltransferase [Alphaproteobacteria bacterium]|nr:bifunctional enoyl-CoA hydratase/phosphate acetyltransferase [Alphaproteobacteria bacterium]